MIHLDDHITCRHLSRREREVLELIALGTSPDQIALQLGMSREAVSGHDESIRSKLRATNRTQVVAKAIALGLVQVADEKLGRAAIRLVNLPRSSGSLGWASARSPRANLLIAAGVVANLLDYCPVFVV